MRHSRDVIKCMAIFALSLAILDACDVRSGIAKKDMERHADKPAPAPDLTPSGPAIEPADIIEVDTRTSGKAISVNATKKKTAAACAEFNQMMINGSDNVITVKGPCRQIMVNGDGNRITSEAVMEIVFNGTDNMVEYSRFVNGKRPNLVENQGGNFAEKIASGRSEHEVKK